MEYRVSEPKDFECETESEEFDYLHMMVQSIMQNTDKHGVVDLLLILANLCDARSLQLQAESQSAIWYMEMSAQLRTLLRSLPTGQRDALPNLKLENPFLYFDSPGNMH